MPTIDLDLPPPPEAPLRAALDAAYHEDETAAVEALLAELRFDAATQERMEARARRLAQRLRAEAAGQGGVEAFMHAYSLDTHEGVMLMCLAEALLRIPDAETAERLIRDKVADVDWQRRVARVGELADQRLDVRADALGPGDRLGPAGGGAAERGCGGWSRGSGEPVVREALRQAMRILGQQFVLGQTIEQAIERARQDAGAGLPLLLRHAGRGRAHRRPTRSATLGRYAATRCGGSRQRGGRRAAARARRASRSSSRRCIRATSSRSGGGCDGASCCRGWSGWRATREGPRHRRDDRRGGDRAARAVARPVRRAGARAGARGLGRARPGGAGLPEAGGATSIDWLADLARRAARRIMVRLVKGAYWDSEIKRAQERGLAGYPVFTRKVATDVSYLACARRLLAAGDAIYPQFATHNAHTIACVIEMAGNRRDFEFQRLHGMGEALYRDIAEAEHVGHAACRVYAPVGAHEDLLPYLVRRLLENGANSSFVHRDRDAGTTLDELVADPVRRLAELEPKPHPAIRRPAHLFGRCAANRAGDRPRRSAGAGGPEGEARGGAGEAYVAPRRGQGCRPGGGTRCATRRTGGGCWARSTYADAATAERAVAAAHGALGRWAAVPAAERAAILERAAGLCGGRGAAPRPLLPRGRQDRGRLRSRDWREAIDFLRYYAAEARRAVAAPSAAGADGRGEHARAAAAGRVREHLALELPARHLHRPDGGRAGGRQRGGRQAGRGDLADGGARRSGCCTGRACRRTRWCCCRARAGWSARRW